MSISSALNSAMSGLFAASRSSALVSENIANAMTPGYSRRSLELGSNTGTGSGVQVLGIHRHSDPGLIANRRGADAEHGAASVIAGFHARLETLVGTATDDQSISSRLADLESSLIAAASRPESIERLDAVAWRASGLAGALSDASAGLRDMREAADREIGAQVTRLNAALSRVQTLNGQITAAGASGANTAGLMDQRQALVDDINTIVPVRMVARDHGQIGLYTEGGAIVLDGPAVKVGFTVSNAIQPHMTGDNGLLSVLSINDIPIRTGSDGGALRGGTLGALFRVRDDLAVDAQAGLDAQARDLIERFQTPGVDPTLTAGAPGLFTDAGARFDPVAETGLAGRIGLNAAVDPRRGGQSWLLRAGLGAADPGAVGEARQLTAFADALSAARMPGSGRFGTGPLTAAAIAVSVQSRAAQDRGLSEQALGFASASRTELVRMELAQGVDTDAELQTLMAVEQAYAANVRVIEAVDDMMQTLLRM
jgi:flagellar hook-associated protein 1 FlgK